MAELVGKPMMAPNKEKEVEGGNRTTQKTDWEPNFEISSKPRRRTCRRKERKCYRKGESRLEHYVWRSRQKEDSSLTEAGMHHQQGRAASLEHGHLYR